MRKITIQLGAGKPQWFQKDSDGPQAFYRLWPFALLAKNCSDVHIIEEPGVNLSTLSRADWIVYHTPMDSNILAQIHAAKQYGIKVWVDMDDLVFANQIPPSNPAGFFFRPKSVQETLVHSLEAADVISVTTQALKFALISLLGVNPNKIHVIPNAIPDTIWHRRQKPAEDAPVKKVMWRGSITHEGDLYHFREAFRDYDQVQFLFFGSEPWVLYPRYGGHLSRVMLKDWRLGMMAYFDDLKGEAPHYVVAPLENIAFNHAKSNIAFLEGTLAGAVCIAPAFMPEFCQDGIWQFGKENAQKGQHYAHELGDIFKKINAGQDGQRIELYQTACKTIEKHFLTSVTNQKRLELLGQL